MASQDRSPRVSARVLVVEDDDAMRDLLVEELVDAGFVVAQARNGREGIEHVRRDPTDVVITDLRMPDIDGFDLIRDVRATSAPPHIIMITAFGSIDSAIRAVKLGAYDYITQPFEIEELVLVTDKALKERGLKARVGQLQREVEGKYHFDNIVGSSDAMQNVLSLIERVSHSNVSVLLTGESGTGKELVARAIHYNSNRADHPFVAVNLAAVPEALIESELFGHVRGAFTDARVDRIGLFAEANGGTIFLDEIGELALSLQAKLLRVLQEQEIRPVGGTKTIKVDARVISATNRNLEERMAAEQFREDLYYRLNVFDIQLPPLRQRPSDVIELAEHFLIQASAKLPTPRELRLSGDAHRALLTYGWPGNVRELQNVIERGVALCEGCVIEVNDLPTQVVKRTAVDFLAAALERKMSMSELEREYILRTLADESGNKTRTADRLGLDRKTLYRKLAEYAKTDNKISTKE